MAKSNVTPLRHDGELPPRNILEQRLDEQQQLLTRARGIIGLAEQYADGLMQQSADDEIADLWAALKAAYELIDEAWDCADVVMFFRTESEPKAPAA